MYRYRYRYVDIITLCVHPIHNFNILAMIHYIYYYYIYHYLCLAYLYTFVPSAFITVPIVSLILVPSALIHLFTTMNFNAVQMLLS